MKRNIITLEERTLVKEAVILTFILDVLDRERQRAENSYNLLRGAHMLTLEAIFDTARLELIDIKKELKSRNIKYNEAGQEDDNFILSFEVWCRGYKEMFRITRDHAKSELGVKLGLVSGEIEALLKRRPTR